MSPGFVNALLAFAKGSDPPLKTDGEAMEAFLSRTNDWQTKELRSMRVLLWAIVAMQVANWLHIGPVGY